MKAGGRPRNCSSNVFHCHSSVQIHAGWYSLLDGVCPRTLWGIHPRRETCMWIGFTLPVWQTPCRQCKPLRLLSVVRKQVLVVAQSGTGSNRTEQHGHWAETFFFFLVVVGPQSHGQEEWIHPKLSLNVKELVMFSLYKLGEGVK